MADLVGQHRGQLGLGLGRGDQAGVHADESARQGEGIHGGISHQEELEAEAAGRGRGGKLGAQTVEIVAGVDIVGHIRIAAQVAHDGLAQTPLGVRRELLAAGVTQPGQVVGLRVRSRRQGSQGQRQQRGNGTAGSWPEGEGLRHRQGQRAGRKARRDCYHSLAP